MSVLAYLVSLEGVYKSVLISLASSSHFFKILKFLTHFKNKNTFSDVKLYDESIPHIFRMIQTRLLGQNRHFIKKTFSEFCRFF